ncbi:PREDICTED: brassinosteroid-related acyltransferase 1 [Camelina sativa]|uniref:Brassinosteroid-related acyltransferase 1 n=1 Tax=Camelina sativa TaxID=90675 RepID=A0ABM0TXB5_CAMSA|nr:PREDICTED: brassinosteroid-related acyltransferase 1 [Camelina sativa]
MHMLMATRIDIIQKLNVYPRHQNQDQKKLITLSNLDRQCPLLMYLVFFYKNTTSRDFGSVFSDLKLGLEETLSVWYPAAGRLALDKGGCNLNIQCNDGGAVIVEATVTGVKLLELGDLTQYNEFYETLVYKPSFDGDFSVMPLVVAQVTRFACGGYSIGIGTSHSLFDGISAYDFIHAWAFNSHIHNRSNGKVTNKKDHLVIKPVHDRGNLLFNRDLNQSREALRVTNAAAIDHLYQLIKQAMMTHKEQNRNFELPDSGFVIKTFDLNDEAIESMKKKSLEGFLCSPFEFLAAHLWKARTRALGLRRDAMVCLQFAVDIRKRTEPSLPEGFSGNAYVLASVVSTTKELLEELTLESIVNKIREAKNSIDQGYINSYMEALGGGDQRNDGNLPPLRELTLISDWTKMPFHNVGFGSCGELADNVAPLCPPVPQVAYFMKNPKDAKGVTVRIGFDPRDVNNFTNHFLDF